MSSDYGRALKEALSKSNGNKETYFKSFTVHPDGVSGTIVITSQTPNGEVLDSTGFVYVDSNIAEKYLKRFNDNTSGLVEFEPSHEEHVKANQEAEECFKSIKNDLDSEKALRYNQGKLPMHLVPPSAIKAIASVLEYGANKYTERNWEKGANYSVPYASLMRHLLAFWSGEDNDPESGLPHTYHILMNAAMLVEYEQLDKSLDDRPRKE